MLFTREVAISRAVPYAPGGVNAPNLAVTGWRHPGDQEPLKGMTLGAEREYPNNRRHRFAAQQTP
jgi:hypothetical protein